VKIMRLRRPLILAWLVPVAAFSLLAAGCGGGGSPRVASVATTTTAPTTTTQLGAAVAFSRCMRSNGVPRFPDPAQLSQEGAQGRKPTLDQLGVSATQFDAARRACAHFLPNGGAPQGSDQPSRARLADMLSFARCMRSHGLANFPDPTPQQGLKVEMVQAAGIDVHSPAVLRAVYACLPASHGALTPAKVREALNNAGG
jgi:hypothetical protein